MTTPLFDTLVFVGRFQPFHNSHLQTVSQALALARTVVIVIGSDKRPRTPKNPFSTQERRLMIEAALMEHHPGDLARIRFVAVRDYFDGPRWARAVFQAVQAVVADDKARVGLIGHAKDHSTTYLDDFPDWQRVPLENIGGLNATDIRQQWYSQCIETEAAMPAAVVKIMQKFRQRPEFVELKTEHAYLESYRESWKHAPYPPTFVTVDALVQCQNSVLLIQRGGFPGRGQWATPGGFLDPHERIINAAWRELQEETGLVLNSQSADVKLVAQAYFDHPERSARGRTITHVFHFDLGNRPLPEIKAADDAMTAQWVPIAALPAMESNVFEDHFVVLEHFLGLKRID